MKRKGLLALSAAVIAALIVAGFALAQSGHFVGTPTCTDTGTTLTCSGKVAGLGGTTFRIEVVAPNAVADVTCTNPGGNVAPGQSFDFTATGSTGDRQTPRNGQFRFNNLSTTTPSAPPGSCPNPMWTAAVTDVHFSGLTATLNLYEGNTLSDSITVNIP